jgi:hypothetical protein
MRHELTERRQVAGGNLDQAEVGTRPQCIQKDLNAWLLGQKLDASAREQRGQQAGNREVESERRMHRRPPPLGQGISLDAPGQVIDHSAVADHDPLGLTGRAGGVHHVGEMLRAGCRGKVTGAALGEFIFVTIEAYDL